MEYATEAYPVDPSKRFLLGFSQGAILSMSLALTMGGRLRGIVALNGYVPAFVKQEYALQSLDETPIFISHGEYDPIFPVSIGHETAAYFAEKSSRVTFRIYPSGHTVTARNQSDFLDWLRKNAEIEIPTEGA